MFFKTHTSQDCLLKKKWTDKDTKRQIYAMYSKLSSKYSGLVKKLEGCFEVHLLFIL